jgi:hypothetical protein
MKELPMANDTTTMLSRASGKTEIRFEVDSKELAVLDGHCSAEGVCRTEVIKELLVDWSRKRLNSAIVICRVAGVNPMQPDGSRSAKE